MTRIEFLGEINRLAIGFKCQDRITEQRVEALFTEFGGVSHGVFQEAVRRMLCEPTFPGRRKMQLVVADVADAWRDRVRSQRKAESQRWLDRASRPSVKGEKSDALTAKTWMCVAMMVLTNREDEIEEYLIGVDQTHGTRFLEEHRMEQGRATDDQVNARMEREAGT